ARTPRGAPPWRALGIGAAVIALVALAAFALTRLPSRSADATSTAAPAGVPGNTAGVADAAPVPNLGTAAVSATPAAAPSEAGTEFAGAYDESATPLPAVPPAEEDPAALRTALATTVVDPVPVLLALANADLAAQRYTQPAGRNALERYELAAKLAERRRATRELERARQGIAAVASGYIELAEKRYGEGNEREFLELLGRADQIAARVPEGAAPAQRVRERRARLRDAAIEAGSAAAAKWDQGAAIAAYERALTFDAGSKEAQRGLADARRIGRPGFVFRDAATAPEMIVVPGGKLAVARTETTVADFRRYWQARGARARGNRPACRDRESFFRGGGKSRSFESPGYPQSARHPVVCVAWADADDYARWLSRETGKRYRLPSASEWTGFARGAGGAADCRANVADSRYRGKFDAREAYGCDDRHAEAAPVASYDASPAGLHDLAGNVREWLGDCAQGCREHAAIGSAWFSAKDRPEVAQRVALGNDVAANTVGFRVVREID
ncbi:MAG TPA: SUMF1/EgtB/PvdO family nonheme iron enzyme, partial [Candidatus Saccharimonadia bacterium]|nr:SUMF1/EgtB/PvdO family nonheme iron enzyme [Candidatus Saccharimonadia bacterium]